MVITILLLYCFIGLLIFGFAMKTDSEMSEEMETYPWWAQCIVLAFFIFLWPVSFFPPPKTP